MKWPCSKSKPDVVTIFKWREPTPGSDTNHILELFCENSTMTIADVSRKAGLHRLTTAARLNTLAELGYLSKERVGTAWAFTLVIDLYSIPETRCGDNAGY